MGFQKLQLGWVLLLVCIFSASNGQVPSTPKFDFNCKRDRTLCLNGTCDLTTNECACSDPNVNYRCQSIEPSGTCSPPCENSGICVTDQCVCTQDYYGNACEKERVQVECEGGDMFINVNIEGQFAGLIYLMSNESTSLPACQLVKMNSSDDIPPFVKDQDREGIEGYSITVQSDSADCGTIESQEFEDTAGTTYSAYERKFLIQYNENYKSSVDQIIIARCKVMGESNSTLYSVLFPVEDSDSALTNVDVLTETEPVTLDITDAKGETIKNPVMLGAEIHLVFSMVPSAEMTDFRIISCEANNTVGSNETSFRKLEFLTNGCPTDQGIALFYGGVEKSKVVDQPIDITINLKAFKFLGDSSRVAFVCVVGFCDATTEDECAVKTCDGLSSSKKITPISNTGAGDTSGTDNAAGNGTVTGNEDATSNSTSNIPGKALETPPVKRRRRSTTDDKQVSGTITVIDPMDVKALNNMVETEESNEPDCLEQPNYLAVVIILAVILAMLLIVIVVLVAKRLSSRSKVDVHNTRYPEPVQTMRIPRLELHTQNA